MTLREVLVAAADEADLAAVAGPDGAATWSHGERPFARLDADGRIAEFRLDPILAAAALRTPDTRASDLGPEWVVFAPPVVDGHAEDRARAWFAAASRRAVGGR